MNSATALSIPEARYAPLSQRVLLNGTQAVVRMLLEQAARDRAAGLTTGGYVSGYRGSPVSSIDLEMQRNLKRCADANVLVSDWCLSYWWMM